MGLSQADATRLLQVSDAVLHTAPHSLPCHTSIGTLTALHDGTPVFSVVGGGLPYALKPEDAPILFSPPVDDDACVDELFAYLNAGPEAWAHARTDRQPLGQWYATPEAHAVQAAYWQQVLAPYMRYTP
jgi:hypothetical protein